MCGRYILQRRLLYGLAATLLGLPLVHGANYYVSPSGFDGASGALNQPFQTIQKAASVMVAGDTAYIRGGVYRETVTPANSGAESAPVTFMPYNGEPVTVSGADVIPANSWTLSSGSIYKAPMSWDLGDGNNQVFLDGKMMIEARWPNTTLDVSNPKLAHIANRSYVAGTPLAVGTITDPSLPSRPANYWNGATIHISLLNVPWDQGAGYFWQTGTVVSSTAGQLSFTWTQVVYPNWPYGPQPNVPGPMNPYYLTGELSELDAAGEWFLDSASSRLYFWTPAGDSPAQHLAEAKRRQFAFDLSGRSFITIQGLNTFAATINSDPNSQYLVLDGLNAQYLSHYSLLPGAQPNLVEIQPGGAYPNFAGMPGGSGIILNGNNDVLRNSSIAFSAGNGVTVIGGGHRVFNNVIHDADYIGADTSPVAVAFYDPLTLFIIAWNTIYNSGSQGIWDGFFGGDGFYGPQPGDGRILHNEIYNYALQVSQTGCTYTYQTSVQGSEIAYNRCHDSSATAHLGMGLNFDSAISNFIVHHNVVWNVPRSLNLGASSGNNGFYNNTFAGTDYGMTPLLPPGQTLPLPGTALENNIFTAAIQVITGAVLQENILAGTDPQFVDPADGNFQLEPTSPAIGAGVAIPPYTDGFTGPAPDIGAYDHTKPAWKAGVQAAAYTVSAASYGPALSPGSIAVVFGTVPFDQGVSVLVTDGAGVDLPATLLYVAATPPQLAFVVPGNAAAGVALITITNADGTISLSSAPVFPVAPGLFSADASGQGIAAAGIQQVAADGSQTYGPVAAYDAALGSYVAIPIDLSSATDQVFLVLYGTGIRGRSSLSGVTVTVGGVNATVYYAGSQNLFPGLDQVDVLLPKSLAGSGSVNIGLTVDGQPANSVTVTIK